VPQQRCEISTATPRIARPDRRFPSQEAVNPKKSAQLTTPRTEHCDVVAAPTHEAAVALVRLCTGVGLRAVAQPIVRLTDMTVVGYEALTRVDDQHGRSIQWWLDRATEHGVRSQFEVACWRTISRIGGLPDDGLLFANVGPTTLLEPELWSLRDSMPARLVIELMPDFLKLDRAMVTGIDRDRNRLALVRSLVAFAREVGTSVIAEGIERVGELETLRAAGVAYGQGYLLTRPGPPWPNLAHDQSRARRASRLERRNARFACTRRSAARATRTRPARSSSITSSARAR
jgi:EAL domain-containing protein (putative c-di-GMP-specific phosphodiesterase class I)